MLTPAPLMYIKRDRPSNPMSDVPYSQLPCSHCVARDATLCASLSNADMDRLYSLASERSFPTGELLIRQEQAADFVFSIRSGHATMFRLTRDGKRQILAFLFPGASSDLRRRTTITMASPLFLHSTPVDSNGPRSNP